LLQCGSDEHQNDETSTTATDDGCSHRSFDNDSVKSSDIEDGGSDSVMWNHASLSPCEPPGHFGRGGERTLVTVQTPCAPRSAVSRSVRRSLPRRQKAQPWVRAGSKPPCSSDDGHTTLVLKRLPSGCTRESLCALLDSTNFTGRYNFLYMPAHFKSWTLFRYAFINFETHADAARAILELPLAPWPCSPSCALIFDGPVDAMWSTEHQGLETHLERYRNSPVMHEAVPDAYKPIFLKDGKRVRFPQPTRRLQPPRSLPSGTP